MEIAREKNSGIEEYNTIDLLKYICALLVVSLHVSPLGSNNETNIELNFFIHCIARIAVPFFFVSSGFFLFRKRHSCESTFNVGINYAKRIIRLYLIWTMIYFPWVMKDILTSSKGVLYGVVDFCRRLVLSGDVTTHLWYLHALAVAVVLLAILMKCKIKLRIILAVSSVLYLIGLLVQFYLKITDTHETITIFSKAINLYISIFGTVRNGLFEGLFFVVIGVCLSNWNISMPPFKSLIAFFISLIFLFLEIIVLTKITNYNEPFDMYFMLVPTVMFLFLFAKDFTISDHCFYKSLRIVSSLVYYLHIMIRGGMHQLLSLINNRLSTTCLLFVFTVLVTSALSYVIYNLSHKKNFIWLKWLYK